MSAEQTRTYRRAESIVFLKTNDPFGGLSNMAGGFPLCVNGLHIRTSEALYQACRFPRLPDVQKLIIEQKSPMTAKMKSKPHRKNSRADWNRVRVKIMRWCLRVKLAQNWATFSWLLQETGDRPIVEESRKDAFWGAKPVDENTLVGMNVLGRLLMELREAVKKQGPGIPSVEPLSIPEFLLLGRPIEPICERRPAKQVAEMAKAASASDDGPTRQPAKQTSLFDVPTAREAPAPAYVAVPTSEDALLSDLKPYSAVRESGVPWLGDVPAHWDVQRLRNAAEMRVSSVDKHTKDDEQPVRLCNYVDVYKNDRIRSGMPFMRATATVDEIERFRLRTGDVLITKDSEAWNDIGVPALVEETDDNVISGYHLALLRPFEERVEGGYLFHALQSTTVAYQFHVEANGVTRYGLSHSAIKSTWLPLPPLPEQTAIVRFLDHADRRIRRYIRAKQRLIKLLEEQKQAIIHRAVTCGLDPDVRLKPSGVEWLGEVPEHWEIWKIGHFATVGNGSTPSRGNVAYWSGGTYPWLNSSSVKMGCITTSNQFVTDAALRECHLPRVPSGSVLVAITGQGKTRGTAAVLTIEATINQHIAFIAPRTSSRVAAEYLRAFLVAAYSELRRISDDSGSTKGALTCDDLRSFRVALPPLEEQHRIVKWSSEATADVESALSVATREISLLGEYRTRLIADVVTGKLDVREAAARLPNEVDEPDPPDQPDDDAVDDDAMLEPEEDLEAIGA
jgi:type I restriction enzyme S subunit